LPRLHKRAVSLSVLAPIYDEVESLRPLVEAIREALDGHAFEIVLVDDGSSDASAALIRALADQDARVRGVFQPEHRGQTSALSAGLEHVRGDVIATLDADLQNDPADIPRLLGVLGENDAVVGYRLRRRDDLVRRTSSRIANAVRNRLTGDSVRDTGCSLKVFRRHALTALPLFEGMHRFLPTLLRMHGFRVIEHPVAHHPRLYGTSKYGVWNRAFRALRDLIAVRWMRSRVIVPYRASVYERETS
jgi:glycosyltransferase involved in cell wall biosynthesis